MPFPLNFGLVGCLSRDFFYQIQKSTIFFSSYLYLHHLRSSVVITMASKQLKIFKPFDLQSCLSEDSLNIQETINYAEHRFRDILMIYGRADHNRQRLLQRGLHKELVSNSFMIYIPFNEKNLRNSYYLMLARPPQ